MPTYTYTVTQEVHYFDPVEFDSPGAVLSWIELGEWDRKHNEVKDQRVRIYSEDGTLVADSAVDPDDVTIRPTGHCGCGCPVVWVQGRWEHDAAPYLWGNDHEAGAPAPTGGARDYWDREDGVIEDEDDIRQEGSIT